MTCGAFLFHIGWSRGRYNRCVNESDLGAQNGEARHTHSDAHAIIPLTSEESEVLNAENEWWIHREPRQKMLQRLGMSSTHYALVLAGALKKPAALIEKPELVRRLTRLQQQREHERFGWESE